MTKRPTNDGIDNAALLKALRKEIRALVVASVAPVAPVAGIAAPPSPQIPVDDFNNSVLYKLGKIESLLGEVNIGLVKHVADDALLHSQLTEQLGLVEKSIPDKLDTRLRSVERSRTYVIGAGATMGIVLSALTNFAYRYLHP
jgi:hypothetical protein